MMKTVSFIGITEDPTQLDKIDRPFIHCSSMFFNLLPFYLGYFRMQSASMKIKARLEVSLVTYSQTIEFLNQQ